MGKIRQLKGVAHNLADSFLGPQNIGILDDTLNRTKLSAEGKMKSLKIDLLKENISPKKSSSNLTKNLIQDYKGWFLSELEKMKIKPTDIEKVFIKITYKPGKSFGRYYNCNVTIKAKGKEYSGKVLSSWT
ncbi:MAG: hypothetical protein AABW61_00165 [Candidatus Aenigmatarchaeota archaeon]